MASSNRTAFILKTVRDTLDTVNNLTVLNVFKERVTTGITAYPFILNQATTMALDEGGGDTNGVAQLNVILHKAIGKDTADAGTGTDAYAELIEDIEDAFADLQSQVTSQPLYETHGGGRFKTAIYNVIVTGWDGYFDVKADQLRTACSIDVYYRHIAL